ncbi:putative oxidoreductase YdgJ [Methyloligella halotolerans]|uniref:Putative oxidoreductase YdgJ n=1 Tax=Methyloligella halotolerans TaxID=1177755 RepID=A0A1E2RVK4_9HYPH|nr:putative oxidoreductase YdgJ [Methyloligella halotolerans]
MPRVAVIGCGAWGKNLIRNFADLGALEAVIDHSPETAAAFAEKHDARVLDYDAALADETIDGIVVAVPGDVHYDIAKRALQAGKHVYVEKPLTLRLDEAEELAALAEEKGLALMVGHLLQYHPVFQTLRQLVEDGRLGELRYVYSNRLALGRIVRDQNALWDLAPHDISMVLSLMGAEPDEVDAFGACHLKPNVADTATLHLNFPGEPRAQIFVSWFHPFKEHKLVAIGTEGMAVFNDGEAWDDKLLLYPHGLTWDGELPVPDKAEAERVAVPQAEPLKEECRHFLDCIATGATPRTDGREALRVQRVLEKASQDLTARGIEG